jgi:hypothetical protein
MSILAWARWPELQKERVRKEVAVRLGTRNIDERPSIIGDALYELYPYTETDTLDYNKLVDDIYTDIRSKRHAL